MSARARIETLLAALSGGWPWACWDAGLSLLLDAAVIEEETSSS